MTFVIHNHRPEAHGRDIELRIELHDDTIAAIRAAFPGSEPVTWQTPAYRYVSYEGPVWYGDLRAAVAEALIEFIDEALTEFRSAVPVAVGTDGDEQIGPDYECYFDYGYSSGDETDFNRLTYDLIDEVRAEVPA